MSARTQLLFSICTVVAVTSVAGARPVEIAEERPTRNNNDRRDFWRAEGAIGVRFGSFFLNGATTGTAIPFHLDGGFRKQRVLLYAEYGILSMTAPKNDFALRGELLHVGGSTGLLHRGSGNVRYAFGRAGEHDGGAEVWAEAGLGVQHFRWDAGGEWTRPDVSLGIGLSMIGLGKTKHGGFTIGLRVTLARQSDASTASVCGGPCDNPTPPPGFDRSFLFDMTALFGK